ncbi:MULTISPECIES: 5'-methylthioadenosine/S-adenosylhomocysteine nucleosidase [unclassified Streptomyces]|uniref:5'-methylthioadenosine/S-adenosylhomocysteine nucleosidase n=1 Tax=unclassified Streptomyces TaxID=2593676 RepID=UPI002E7A5F98|nr:MULTISPECIES: 5'-methylthioadenosine/S-adenosylhomocysteine nucleosidase [unclassified Streptomyces]MEE1764680.1 5'-methylthioadenosine/S-adenosylhomocysteine nucleosidase [Streptomyces sp. SP18BB07]MEE1833681.1 5'-methylthioadenosine/S-adenosylhomocysteine nucleosidase [Streptomyces sp. SP17KL33]
MPQTHPTVLVLTALALEYAAVRPHIEDREELVHPDDAGTRVEHGRLSDTGWYIALAELGEGNSNAAALTTQIIGWLKPEAVLFVGVAGSLKSDIGLGDVVVGTKVYGIHGGKQTETGFQVRPEAWPVSNALVSAARSAVRDMDGVRAHFKPIASGDVVLADAESEIATHLRERYNDAAAIEMEGAGALRAAHLNGQLHALVLRGISDHADAAKHTADATGSQERAAAQAASVAVATLRKHRPRAVRIDSSDTEEGPQRVGGASHRGDHVDLRGGTFYGPVIGKQIGHQP